MIEPEMRFTNEEFAAWRHHPATKKFLRFLAGYEQWLRQSFEREWLEGRLPKMDEGAVRGRIVMCREIQAMSATDVEAFYQQEDADEAQAAETEDGTRQPV